MVSEVAKQQNQLSLSNPSTTCSTLRGKMIIHHKLIHNEYLHFNQDTEAYQGHKLQLSDKTGTGTDKL